MRNDVEGPALGVVGPGAGRMGRAIPRLGDVCFAQSLGR